MPHWRVFLAACFFLVATPAFVSALNIQSDMQCPPGGVVGQTCQDNTNGYVTAGHCTHIGVCKADSWNTNAPKGCGSSGNINAPTADCPKAPPIPAGKPTPQMGTTSVITIGSNTAVNSDLFNQAYSAIAKSPISSAKTVSTTTLDGIEYFISGGEALAAGAKLTEEAPQVAPPPRSTLALGSVYDLRPTSQRGTVTEMQSAYGQDYRPSVAGFTNKSGEHVATEQEQVNFADQFASLWTNSFHGYTDQAIDFLYFASALSPQISPTVSVHGPYQDMYTQVMHGGSTFFDATTPTGPSDYRINERLNHMSELFSGAAADIATAGHELFSGQVAEFGDYVGAASEKTVNAFGLMGNLAAALMLRSMVGN